LRSVTLCAPGPTRRRATIRTASGSSKRHGRAVKTAAFERQEKLGELELER
jgi:hypothetical protein